MPSVYPYSFCSLQLAWLLIYDNCRRSYLLHMHEVAFTATSSTRSYCTSANACQHKNILNSWVKQFLLGLDLSFDVRPLPCKALPLLPLGVVAEMVLTDSSRHLVDRNIFYSSRVLHSDSTDHPWNSLWILCHALVLVLPSSFSLCLEQLGWGDTVQHPVVKCSTLSDVIYQETRGSYSLGSVQCDLGDSQKK